MTVAAYSKVQTDCDGASKTFPFTEIAFFNTSEIVVTLMDGDGAEAVLTETTHYSLENLTGDDPYTGGEVLTVALYANTYTIIISRAMTLTQTTDLQEGGELPSDSLEDRFDKLTMMVQDIDEVIDRCVKFPIGDSISLSPELVTSADRASAYLICDASGNISTTGSIISATEATVSPYMTNVVAAADIAAAQVLLGILNEDDLGSDSDERPATQQSIKAYIDTDDTAMVGKVLTAPTMTAIVVSGTSTIADGMTITTPVITNPTINAGIGGTAVLDENGMATDSNTQIATQQSIKSFVEQRQAGSIVQVVHEQTLTMTSGAIALTTAGTDPFVNTEGVEVITADIIPDDDGNTLLIEAVINMSAGGVSYAIGLFQDSIEDPLAMSSHRVGSVNDPQSIRLSYSMPAGTESSTTFKIRATSQTTTNVTINGVNGSAYYDGKLCSSITITEIKVGDPA